MVVTPANLGFIGGDFALAFAVQRGGIEAYLVFFGGARFIHGQGVGGGVGISRRARKSDVRAALPSSNSGSKRGAGQEGGEEKKGKEEGGSMAFEH